MGELKMNIRETGYSTHEIHQIFEIDKALLSTIYSTYVNVYSQGAPKNTEEDATKHSIAVYTAISELFHIPVGSIHYGVFAQYLDADKKRESHDGQFARFCLEDFVLFFCIDLYLKGSEQELRELSKTIVNLKTPNPPGNLLLGDDHLYDLDFPVPIPAIPLPESEYAKYGTTLWFKSFWIHRDKMYGIDGQEKK
jgi:hypothetical protein